MSTKRTRPGPRFIDSDDPEVMELTANDPVFRRWFEQRMRVHERFAADVRAQIVKDIRTTPDTAIALDVLIQVLAGMWVTAVVNHMEAQTDDAVKDEAVRELQKGVIVGLELLRQLVQSETPMAFAAKHFGTPQQINKTT